MAEGIMRAEAARQGMDIEVDSAGTSAWHVGESPDDRAVANMQQHNIDISNLRARKFEVSDFDHFDYIFVMDQNNFKDVTSSARNSDDKLKVKLLMDMTSTHTGLPVPDPYFGGDEGFENVYHMLTEACERIAAKLTSH